MEDPKFVLLGHWYYTSVANIEFLDLHATAFLTDPINSVWCRQLTGGTGYSYSRVAICEQDRMLCHSGYTLN